MTSLLLVALLLQGPTLSSTPARPLGTLREQAAVQQQWLQYRVDSVLPRLMRQNGVEMWIVAMREYNEDPVFWSLVSPTTMFARRRTIYVFSDRGSKGIERLALGGGSQGGVYEAYVARDTATAADIQAVLDRTFGSIPDLEVPSRDEWEERAQRLGY